MNTHFIFATKNSNELQSAKNWFPNSSTITKEITKRESLGTIHSICRWKIKQLSEMINPTFDDFDDPLPELSCENTKHPQAVIITEHSCAIIHAFPMQNFPEAYTKSYYDEVEDEALEDALLQTIELANITGEISKRVAPNPVEYIGSALLRITIPKNGDGQCISEMTNEEYYETFGKTDQRWNSLAEHLKNN